MSCTWRLLPLRSPFRDGVQTNLSDMRQFRHPNFLLLCFSHWPLCPAALAQEAVWVSEIIPDASVFFSYFRIISKSTVLWDMTLCDLVAVYRRFGGTHCHARSQREARATSPEPLCANIYTRLAGWPLAWRTLRPWRWRRCVPQKCQ
jgi:hypothetical protein